MSAMTKEALQELLDRVEAPYSVDNVSDGLVSLRLPVSNAHIRPGGTISGPALMALADGTAWAAVMCEIGANMSAVSASLHIDFLRRPQPVDVIGEGRVLRLGKALAVIEVSMRSDTDVLVAKSQVTYAIPPGRDAPQSRG